jgi:EpsG family
VLIYFIVLLLGLVPAALSILDRRSSTPALVAYAILLTLFTGLRDQVGTDWSGYEDKMSKVLAVGFPTVLLQVEPGFSLLIIASDALGLGLYGVNMACAALFVGGLLAWAMRTTYPWVAMVVVVPYLVYVISMSGVRQAAAMGVCFYMLSQWWQLSFPKRLGYILLAAMFHASAVVFLIFLIAGVQMRRSTKVALVLAMVGLVLGIQVVSNFMDKYSTSYVEKNVESKGAFVHVLLSAFPGMLYLAFKRRIDAAGLGGGVLTLASWLVVLLLPLTFVSSTAASRLSLYFSFLQMWIYPALIHVFTHARSTLAAYVAVLTLSVFAVYFVFGSHAYSYLPYQNVLTGVIDW